jgi:hypothetical protein
MIRRNFAVAIVALVCALVAPAQAQQQRRGGTTGISPSRLSPTLQTKLNLTAEQKTKLQEIAMKLREEQRALGQGGDRAQARQLTMKAETDALGVLTADQKKTYEGWKTELEPYRGLGRTHVALLAVTGLSAEQKTKLKDLASSVQAKRQAAGQGADRAAAQAAEMETQNAIKGILTADQQKQFTDEVALIPQQRRRQQQ